MTGRSLTLSTKGLAVGLGIPAALAGILQLTLGASLLVLSLAIIVACTGLLAFVVLGAYNAGAWLALFYVSGNVLIALYAKTLMRQPLDSHLYVPVASFTVLTISTLALFAALLIVRRINLGRPVLQRTTNPRNLLWLSWGSFFLGVASWFLNQHFQEAGGSGFGGFAVFRDLLLMGVIARTALILQRSRDLRTMDLPLALILTVSVLLGLLTNSKTYAAYPVLSYFATLVFFRRGLAIRHMALLIATALPFILVVTPLIQAWRYQGIQRMPVASRIAVIEHGVADLLAPGQFRQYGALAKIGLRGGYYDYFGGNGRGQVLLGRYASVQQIDPVVEQTNSHGTMGSAALWPALTRLLPSVLYPNKPQSSEAYTILVHFGLIDAAGGKYPTLPLAGQAYAGYGFGGLVAISFLTFLTVLIALKKFGWDLYRNVFAIFIFSEFIVVYAGQGDLSQYVGLVVRAMPEFVAVFWMLQVAPRLLWRRPAPTDPPVLFMGNSMNARE